MPESEQIQNDMAHACQRSCRSVTVCLLTALTDSKSSADRHWSTQRRTSSGRDSKPRAGVRLRTRFRAGAEQHFEHRQWTTERKESLKLGSLHILTRRLPFCCTHNEHRGKHVLGVRTHKITKKHFTSWCILTNSFSHLCQYLLFI